MASLYAEIGAKTDGFERGASKVKGELKSIAPALENVTRGVTGFVSANAGLISVLAAVGLGLKKVLNDHVAYANEVRQLSAISGESAETTSRFIQVLDDYKISSQDALAATRALTNEGHVPSIETLAKLSDQYLAITDAEKKNEFVIKNLGRGGLQWIEVLNKGSAALLKQGAAVDKSLILTQKMVDDARKAEIAQDGWNDAILGAKTALSVGLLPALTAVINRFTVGYEAAKIFYGALFDGEEGTVGYFEALDMANEAQQEQIRLMMESEGAIGGNTSALSDNKTAVEAAKDALKEYEDQLDAVSQANIDNEATSRQIAEDRKQYEEDHKNAIEAQIEAQRKLNEALHASGEGGSADAIAEAQAAYDDATKSVQALEAASMEASTSMVYDMVQAKLAIDGLTDSELKALDAYAVSKGIKSQADVDETNRRIDEANAVVEGIKASEDVMVEDKQIAEEKKRLETALSAEEAIAAGEQQVATMNNVTASIDSATQSYIGMAAAAYAAAAAAATIPTTGGSTAPLPPMHSQDSGGVGFAGVPYMIGRGAQPEVFIPKTDGTFIPNADKKGFGGATYNIVINNPIGEPTDNSIRKSLKTVSSLGLAA